MENSKFKYKCFSLYLPSILAIISLSFSGLSLGGQTRQEKSSREVYALKLDFSNINFTAIVHPTNETNNKLSTLRRYYYFGLWNHCGSTSSPSSDAYFYCSKKDAAYQYDLYEIIEEKSFSYKTRRYIDYLTLPDGSNPPKKHVDLIFAVACISVALLVISTILLVGFIVFGKDRAGYVIIGDIFIATVFLGISVVSAQRTFSKIIKNFTNSYDEFGIHASFGNRVFYSFLWCAFTFQLLSLIMIISSNYFLSEAEKNGDFVNGEPDLETPTSSSNRGPTNRREYSSSNQENPDANEELPPRYEEINNHRAPKAPTFFTVSPDGVVQRYRSAN